MKKIDLISTFVKAEILNMEFIAIYLETPAGNEVIVIQADSFEKKCEFYTNAYTDDLVHCMNDKVKIKGFTFGNSFDEVHKNLFGL